MNFERYPSDLTVTEKDFTDCGWKDVLGAKKYNGYLEMWHAFSDAARQAIAEGRYSHGKVLWLLADACSMMLNPKSYNEPFKPAVVMEGGRSAIPDDLHETDIHFFSRIIDSIDDIWLKARLADLVWLKQKPRDIRFALIVIDSYRSIPLDTETWIREGQVCWERAINLARLLNTGAGNRLQEMEATVIKAFDSATCNDGFLGFWLTNLLSSNGLGQDKRSEIAQKLESLACEFKNRDDLHACREFFVESAKWYKAAGNNTKSVEMTVELAEGWVKEAEVRLTSSDPSHMVAATFYENAIQVYRTIPRSERKVHRVDERIAELRLNLNESGRKALDEMKVIHTQGIDLSQIIEDARNSIKGKSTQDALLTFVNYYPGLNKEELRQNVITKIQKYPLQTIFQATTISHDGRVIAKRPGIGLSDAPSPDDEITINAEMIDDFKIRVGITVQGYIQPAHEVLLLEHHLQESDFIDLASQSPIVPKGRERLLGMALYAGYDKNYITSLHLLVPQIEHMVRYHLKSGGVKTTTLDSNGIENENGLSSLMDMPESEIIFGEDLAFEIKALFCDPFGPNLRNELAHGLLDDHSCQSTYAIYSWWFGLRLVLNAFWNATHTNSGSEKEEISV